MATAKKEYHCLNAVLHNGKRHTKTIELTDTEAVPLLKAHAISKHDPSKRVDAEADAKAKADADAAKEKAAADEKAKAEADAKAKAGK
jgi:hypothetical protein